MNAEQKDENKLYDQRIKEALALYRELGLAVFPVAYGSKAPPEIEWSQYHAKPPSWDQVEKWFGDGRRHNIAIICGEASSNLVVLDEDVPGILSKLFDMDKLLRETPVAKTARGRYHVYLRSEKTEGSLKIPEIGLEVRSRGNYVLAPPSYVRDLKEQPPIDGSYEFINPDVRTILTVPDLVETVWKAAEKLGVKRIHDFYEAVGREQKTPYRGEDPPCIAKLLRGEEKGNRNEAGIRIASHYLIFRGEKYEKVEELLLRWRKRNDPPLSEDEIGDILSSASKMDRGYGCRSNQAWCDREKCPLAKKPEEPSLSETEKNRTLEVAKDPRLLFRIVCLLRKRVIGEDETSLCTHFNIVSCKTYYAQSGVLDGESASGKNQVIRANKPLIPPTWVFEFTISTPEAIKYIHPDFDGCLIIYEMVGISSQTGTLGLRAIGETESIATIYPMREENTGRMILEVHKTNAKNFESTTTSLSVDQELATRTVRNSMDESGELTRKVVEKKINEAWMPPQFKEAIGIQDTGFEVTEKDIQNLYRFLNMKAVVHAYVPVALDVLGKRDLSLRRHIDKILNYTRLVALLYQHQRPRYKIGDTEFIIALPSDVMMAWLFCRKAMIETIRNMGRRLTETYQAVRSKKRDFITTGIMVSETGEPQNTIRKRLDRLSELGYLIKSEDKSEGGFKAYFLVEEAKSGTVFKIAVNLVSDFEKKLEELRKALTANRQNTGNALEQLDEGLKEYYYTKNGQLAVDPFTGKMVSVDEINLADTAISNVALESNVSPQPPASPTIKPSLFEKTVIQILKGGGGEMGRLLFKIKIESAGFKWEDAEKKLRDMKGKIVLTKETIALASAWREETD